MDIGKIRYMSAMFRKKPDGIELGIPRDTFIDNNKYEFSMDNGHS